MCCPMVHVPFSGSTEGSRQSLCPARHQGGSSRVTVAILLVVERVVCAVVAAQTATPVSVRIDCRCPAPTVDNRLLLAIAAAEDRH